VRESSLEMVMPERRPTQIDEKPLIVAFSALSPEEWEEVLEATDAEDIPTLRRLRKLGLHRNWRARNREAEIERHRDYYRSTTGKK
jgi:hypothetical protein